MMTCARNAERICRSRLNGSALPLLVFAILAVGFFSAPPCLADTAATDEKTARGVIEARSRATIAAEIVARVAELPFQEGQTFQRGETLLAFDCARQKAEHRAARARKIAKQNNHLSNVELNEHGALGKTELRISAAEYEEAMAVEEASSIQLHQCSIAAPYNGRIVTHHIALHEMPQSNAPLMEIVSSEGLKISLIVPSAWLHWLSEGAKFTFRIDETGETKNATVQRLGAVVDPISQTVRLTAAFVEVSGDVLPGMSGSATFKSPQS